MPTQRPGGGSWKAGSGSGSGGGRGGRTPGKPKNFMDKSPNFTKHPSGNYIEKATGNVFNAAGKAIGSASKKSASTVVKNRAKKIATSAAAKDVKKVTKVAVPVGAGAAVLKKKIENNKAYTKKLEQLRKDYDKSAAKGSISFNEYVQKYGK